MSKQPVRIGFIGAGNMGQCAHLKNYVQLADCQVVALAEPRGDLRQKVASRYGIPHTYENHRALLAAEKDLDGLVVVQPFGRHGKLLPEVAQVGIPMFIEKPLAASIPEAEAIIEALENNGIWLMVGYHKRSDPAAQYAKGEIERLKQTGELGPMRYVRITMPAGDWIAGGFSDLIRSSERQPADPEAAKVPEDMDENLFKTYTSFINYYIHQVNMLRFLLGEPYEVTYADPAGLLLVARSESGITAGIEMSPYTTTIDWHESALVAFQHGYIKVDWPAPLAINRPGRVELFRDAGGSGRATGAGGPGEAGATPQTIVPTLPWVHAMKQQAANFIGAIRGDVQPPCTAEEALEDLRVARQYLRLWQGR
ncbi:MAG TPA: Gfo/Idh/MocA family oxidoreductase [Firmicutes bacterium]|nr:Gfo/Idh/MocA family oxidoreductase [Bacillota bacterium]